MTTPSQARPVPYLTTAARACFLCGGHSELLKVGGCNQWFCARHTADEANAELARRAGVAQPPLFTPAPTLRRKPFEVTLLRSRWIYGARIDADGRTDVIGAYLLAAGVSESELRDCAHLWPWSGWARKVDVLAAQCVQANQVARLWSLRASLAEAQQREADERHAAQLEQQLIALFAAQGVCLSILGELTPAVH